MESTTSAISSAQPAPMPATEAAPEDRGGFFSGIKRFFGFIAWILTGFGLIGAVRRRRERGRADEIILYTVHPSFYLWLIILIGFISAACVRHWPDSAPAWGWVYVFAMLFTIVTLLYDVSTLKALLWGGIFALLWITSKYLEDMKHLTILSGVWRYLAGLHPKLDVGMAAVISLMLIVPWIFALFHSFSRGRKAFSPNSIEEWYLCEGREITDRSGLKFRTRYRDLFETFLGLGAGDLEAVDGNQQVVKRWSNILFLYFLWPKLDEILHQRSAVVENTPQQPVEVEEVRKA